MLEWLVWVEWKKDFQITLQSYVFTQNSFIIYKQAILANQLKSKVYTSAVGYH